MNAHRKIPTPSGPLDQQTRLSTIDSLYKACNVKFDQVLSITRESKTNLLLSAEHLISDHCDRFVLWAGSIGAKLPASNQASLDWRLRNASDMRDAIVNLLHELSEAIEDLILIVAGNREDRTIEVLDEQASNEATQPVSESSELVGIIGDTISGLFHLTMVIQRATPRDRFEKAVAAKKGTFDSAYDIQHVAQKFTKLHSDQQRWLCEKMGVANSHRRSFFSYCRHHHQQLANESVADRATVAQTTASTLKLDLLPASAQDVTEPEADNISQTSFASSTNGGADDGKLHVPRLHKVNGSLEAFQCPYCFKIIKPPSQRHWKKHVFDDLRPYVCTFKNCALTTFASRSAWFDHEVSEHHSTFQCMFCKHTPHNSADALRRHMCERHVEACPPSAISSLIKASTIHPNRFSSGKCPFCNDWASQLHILNPHISQDQEISVTAKQYRSHVASHLEQLALFTLPKIYDDDENEDQDPSEGRDSQPEVYENLPQNLSNTADSLSKILRSDDELEGSPIVEHRKVEDDYHTDQFEYPVIFDPDPLVQGAQEAPPDTVEFYEPAWRNFRPYETSGLSSGILDKSTDLIDGSGIAVTDDRTKTARNAPAEAHETKEMVDENTALEATEYYLQDEHDRKERKSRQLLRAVEDLIKHGRSLPIPQNFPFPPPPPPPLPPQTATPLRLSNPNFIPDYPGQDEPPDHTYQKSLFGTSPGKIDDLAKKRLSALKEESMRPSALDEKLEDGTDRVRPEQRTGWLQDHSRSPQLGMQDVEGDSIPVTRSLEDEDQLLPPRTQDEGKKLLESSVVIRR